VEETEMTDTTLDTRTRKTLTEVHTAPAGHWVGDGFPVRSLISLSRFGTRTLSPFLLLDYGGPHEFAPSAAPRGVEAHPHKGFETVTVVYQGEVEHRDSTGAAGKIGPGDVQWMTAGAGIVHEEKHSEAFTRDGGAFEMVQLWVNLPAAHKGAPAGYQTLLAGEIPVMELDGGRVRVIAGEYGEVKGAARTFTPVDVWDVRLEAGAEVELPVAAGHTTAIAVLRGRLEIDGQAVGEAEVAVFGREGAGVEVRATAEATFLVLAGQPLDEPVAAYGPFVMNTQQQIADALHEYHRGKMGLLE
jgi:hypothetical protein